MPVYDTSTLGTALNQIAFNDDSITPFYRAKKRSVQRREIAEFDIKLPEGTGDADYQTYIGKSYFVLEGVMYPDDEVGFDEGKKALRKVASLDVAQNDPSSDDGYVPYKWAENDGHDKQLFVKVEYADIPEQSNNGQKLPFRLVCKVKYPVIFAQTANTANIGSASATTSGSSNLSFVLPHAIGLTTYSSNGTVTNDGDLSTYPSIVITGPITTPRITNSTTGEYIELGSVVLLTGQTASITYDQDTLTINGPLGTTVLSSLTSGSTLFKIRPGLNTLTLTGATVGSGAKASVSINSAWPLS